MTQAQITDAVCHTYNQTCVRLILIDEIHRLNPRTTTGAETADLLKGLTERIRATFVYADIDVTTTALFSGARGAQLAGRASLVECQAFPARLGKPAGPHSPTRPRSHNRKQTRRHPAPTNTYTQLHPHERTGRHLPQVVSVRVVGRRG
ncbi:hypothetical protein [Streptomyces sp. NPDC048266]|uniref:hypothetical protein n=1 Tax=Streptomyces sp. NPDC048266 TaxID=3155787 RepID=UPI0033C9275A